MHLWQKLVIQIQMCAKQLLLGLLSLLCTVSKIVHNQVSPNALADNNVQMPITSNAIVTLVDAFGNSDSFVRKAAVNRFVELATYGKLDYS
jgi:hypothetical protein